MHDVFLKFSVDKLRQLASRIHDCLDRLTYDQVWSREAESQNAVGNLVLHLSGNVRQWLMTGVGGQPDVRVRDKEFQARGDIQIDELKERLRTTMERAYALLASLPAERLLERTKIQNYDVTVLEAIYHVVEHFALHAGQIMFATKLFTGKDLGYYRHLSKPKHDEATP
jgi:uncharacterized damage-inducible protein DinB